MSYPDNWTMEDSMNLEMAMFPPIILGPKQYSEYKASCQVAPDKSIEALMAAWKEWEWSMGHGQCDLCCGLQPGKWDGRGETGHNPRCFIAIAMEKLGAEVAWKKEDNSQGKERKGYVSVL